MPRFGLLIASALLVASATGSGMWAPTASTARLFTPANAAPLRLTDPIVVTRDSLRLPSGCGSSEVGMLLSRFAAAVNAGDQAALARLFVTDDPPGRAQEPAGAAFRWYSVTEARSGAAQPWRHRALYDRADLLAYFAERHEQNERMSLIEVEVRPIRLAQAVGLTFKVRREADDLPSWLSPFAGGKAGIDCTEQAIYLWSMGQSDRDFLGQICPRPQGWKPDAPIVVCSGGPNAQAVSPRFRVAPTRVDLPARCKPAAVRRSVARALSAFNLGDGEVFAKRFISGGQFHPYTRSITGLGFLGRRTITRFVRARYRAGDGWTATRLFTPQTPVGLPSRAVFGVDLRVSYQGAAVAEHVGAKLVVDCRSGLLEIWGGPAIKTPPART